MTNHGENWTTYEDYVLTELHYSTSTLDDRKRKLRHLQNNDVTLFPTLNRTQATDYLSKRRRNGATGGTLNHYIKALNGLLRAQHRQDELYKPYPTHHKPKRIPTKEEITDLLKNCTRSHRDKRLKTMIYLTAHTGMRVNELCHLTFKQIDFEHDEILLHRKHDKWTRLPVKHSVMQGTQTPSLKNYIDIHREEPRDKKDQKYVFINERNRKRVTDAVFRVQLKEIATKAGHSWMHPHSLRDFYATWLLELNVRVTVIQEYMGHSDLNTTMIYAKEYEQNIRQVMEKLDMDDLLHGGQKP